MGVQGLKNFISTHTTGSLISKNISKCRLLIDGCNLMYFLFCKQTKTNIAFGGDYDAFVVQVNIFFDALDQCNIEPCVILDGGVSLRKCSIQHGIRSFRTNTFGALNATPEEPTDVIPALLRSVFVAAIRRCGVTILQADDVADDELCTLSHTFGLPVLSADTDFCLRGVPIIFLNTFDYRNLCKVEDVEGGQECNTYIKGMMFSKAEFCKLLDINPDHILLLTSLGMNDFLGSFRLCGFVDAISKNFFRNKTWTDRLFAINAVRKWLSKHKNVQLPQLVRMVVDLHPHYTRPRKMDMLEQLLLRVVQISPYASKLLPWFSSGPEDLACGHAAFVSSCPSNPPPDYDPLLWSSVTSQLMDLHRGKRQKVAQMTSSVMLVEREKTSQYAECPHAETELKFAGGLALPRWFAIAQKQALIHYDAAELLVKKTIFTHPMTEKMNRKSAYLVALPILQTIMAICEKTYLEHEKNFLDEQLEKLQRNEGPHDEQVRERIKGQLMEHQINHIQYMKDLKKMNRKRKKQSGAVERKPKFRMDWIAEDEKKKRRAMKKKMKDKSGKSSESDPRDSVEGSGASSPSCEEQKQEPNKRTNSIEQEEDVDDIKSLPLDSKTSNFEMNYDMEEIGKGNLEEYLGWFKNNKDYHAPQIPDTDSVKQEYSPNSDSETASLHRTDSQSTPLVSEMATQQSSMPFKQDQKPIAQDNILPVEPEDEEQCVTHGDADDTVQNIADSHLDEEDGSDDDGSVYGEDELLNMPTSAFFTVASKTKQDYDERNYRGQSNITETSFNFDSNSFLYHSQSNDAADWRNQDDSDVIIEDSEDDSDGDVTSVPSSSLTNGLQLLQNESCIEEESTPTNQLDTSRASEYESAVSYDENSRTNQVDAIETSEYESAVSNDETSQINQVEYSQGSDCDSDVIIEDAGEESDRIQNGSNSVQVIDDSLIENDYTREVESRLVEEHQEIERLPFLCNAEEQHVNKEEKLLGYSNPPSRVKNSASKKKRRPKVKDFLSLGQKPKHTKESIPRNSGTPQSEENVKRKMRKAARLSEASSLNFSNPTDTSECFNDSKNLPIHLTRGDCQTKSYNDADFQVLFSDHSLTLEVNETSFSPKLMAKLRSHYQNVCDNLKKEIIIVSDAIKQGEDVESARDTLLEKLNDRLMKKVRGYLEQMCDKELLKEGQNMSDIDYNICFLNGALQQLDVEKVIPYRERLFKWYVRKSYLRSMSVLKLKNETNLSSIHAMQELASSDTCKRKNLVYQLLNEPSNTYNCLPNDLQLMLVTISYWYNNSSLRLNRCHVYVLLLCIVMFYFIDPVIGRERHSEKLRTIVETEKPKSKGKKKVPLQVNNKSPNHNIAFIANHLDKQSCFAAALSLSKYHTVNKSITTGKLKKHFVHSMCEFQACYHYIGALNSCVGSPFLFPSIDQVLNCTFAYNVFRELSISKYPGTLLSQWLGDKMQMTYLYDALHQFVGKAINIPMVLDLYPMVLKQVNKNGKLIVKHVARINTSEKLKKEKARIQEANEMAELDALTKEFEELDIRKGKQAKHKGVSGQKHVSSTPIRSQVSTKKPLRSKNN